MLVTMRLFARTVALACVFCFFAGADQNGDQSRPETAQAAFDAGTARLTVPFRGNTVEWVLRFGTLAPKSGSETNADYAARQRAFRSEVFAFVLDTHHSGYDRATETLTVRLYPVTTRVGSTAGLSYPAFDVHRTKLPPITRAGPTQWSRNQRPIASERNPVLATTRVSKLAQIVIAESALDVSMQPLTFSLEVAPDRAKAVKSNLRVVLVCMPRFAQFEPAREVAMPEATGVDRRVDGSAQLSDESVTYFVALRCNLLQVWLFDHRTGEVYGRFTPQGVFVPRDGG